MKVCTDACLFGAWVAAKVHSWQLTGTKKIIDIGTGTGLLSLMLAQQTDCLIDAIEINTDAATQANENVKTSPWNNSIRVHQANILDWKQVSYDLIISNPPFYENDLKSTDTSRNLALHDAGLTLTSLFQQAEKLLITTGNFAVLLPAYRLSEALNLGKQCGFIAVETVKLCQTEKHSPFRVMIWFGREQSIEKEYSILIKDKGIYSATFVRLLRDYYLLF